MVVHLGEEGATAFSDIGLIVVYSDNATKRISTHDLEETLFHESVHAAWDEAHADSPAWRDARTSDGAFVTRYAREKPDREDLAESALFAYTLLHHPDRIPAAEANAILAAIPKRIAFVETLLPPGEDIFHQAGPAYACDGSGRTFTLAEDRRPPRDAGMPWGGITDRCIDVDRSTALGLSDILSNALTRGLHQDGSEVSRFLIEAKNTYETAEELVEATVSEFGIERAILDDQIRAFLHCNCSHGDVIPPRRRRRRVWPTPDRPDLARSST